VIAAQCDSYPIGRLCRWLQVARSGFYAWQARQPGPRQRADAALAQTIQVVFAHHRGRYGAPRVHQVLRQAGIRVARKRVARLMRAQGLSGRLRRRWRHASLLPRRLLRIPNRLARRFAPSPRRRCNRVWVADLSYLRTADGWLYLAVVLDLASRKVVGWATGATLAQTIALAALRMALHTRRPAPGLLHHADRGYQYTSADYRLLVRRHGARLSYSRPRNCWDNAVAESFFASLKTELRSRQTRWRTRAEARAAIIEYLTWYNEERLHSSLGYRSPTHYEAEVLCSAS
jgi:putative transposase